MKPEGSLLTDKEMNDIATKVFSDFRKEHTPMVHGLVDEWMVLAQDLKTKRSVVEWLSESCWAIDGHESPDEINYPRVWPRCQCRQCWQELRQGMEEP